MTFAFSEDQRELAGVVSRLLSDHATGPFARAAAADPESWRSLWQRFVDVGIPAMAVPEDRAGLGLGPIELVAVAEVAGGYLIPAPLVETAGVFVPALADAGGEAVAGLDAIVAGAVGTLAFVDPLTGPGAVEIADRRVRATDLLVADADRADWLCLVAEDALAVVPIADAKLEPVNSFDRTRRLSRVDVDFDGAAVTALGPAANPLTVPFIAAAAELVGLGARLVELSVKHAGEREQFGSRIGSFQAVKHRIVDAHLQVERARSLVYRAAVLAAADAPAERSEETIRASHLAKAAANDAAISTARTAVQVHGGVGITVEHDVSLLYLRARQGAMLLGGSDYHYAAALG